MSKKEERKTGYPYNYKSSVKEKDKEEKDDAIFGKKSAPKYGVYNRE